MKRLVGLLASLILVTVFCHPAYADRDGKHAIGVWSLKFSGGLDKGQAAVITDMVASEITQMDHTMKVTSQADMEAMIDLETRKQVAGCDDTSCLTELGAALGMEFLVAGSIGKFDDVIVLNLQLINTRHASVLNRLTKRVQGMNVLATEMPAIVAELFGRQGGQAKIIGAIPTPPPASSAQTTREASALAIKITQYPVNITSVPSGCRLFVDERFEGILPIYGLNVAEGSRLFKADKPGFDPQYRKIKVTGPVDLNFTLSESVQNLTESTEWFGLRLGGGNWGGGGELSFFTVRWKYFFWEILRIGAYGGGGRNSDDFMTLFGGTLGIPIHLDAQGHHEFRIGLGLMGSFYRETITRTIKETHEKTYTFPVQGSYDSYEGKESSFVKTENSSHKENKREATPAFTMSPELKYVYHHSSHVAIEVGFQVLAAVASLPIDDDKSVTSNSMSVEIADFDNDGKLEQAQVSHVYREKKPSRKLPTPSMVAFIGFAF